MKEWDLLTIERNGETLISGKMMKFFNFVGLVWPSEIRHFGQVHTTYQVYSNFTFILKKFIFSLSENSKLNNYWIGTSFLAVSFR